MARSYVKLDTIFNNITMVDDIILSSSRTIPEKVANLMIADMKKSMTEPKHGLMYGSHQASAPGEAPAIEETDLYRSIELVRNSPNEVGISASEEGLMLELGTVYIEPRPWIVPIVEAWRPKYIHEFEGAFARIPIGRRR